MIVEPDVLSHPKFIGLKSLVGDSAMEILVRLWAHCQANKRGQSWGAVPTAYVEIVTTGGSAKGKVYEALLELGWIARVDGNLIVHDWETHNSSLVRNWVRNAKWRQSREDSADKSTGVSVDGSTDPLRGPVHGDPDTTRHDTTRSTEKEEEGAADGKSGPSAADVARSKAQFAALKAVVEETGARMADLTAREREEYRKNAAALRLLQKKQARGEF